MLFRRFFNLFLLICAASSLWAQMKPSAPIQNFRLPRFGDNGYTQWVLVGGKGIYDSEEQVRVEQMALRVYSGDERMAKELTLESPQATLRIRENRAFSDERIEIVGANFRILGLGWEWIGATKEIVVRAETRVEFTQAISGGLPGSAADGGDQLTVIESDQLVLQTTPEAYNFEFSGSVRVRSEGMQMESEVLEAWADAPEGRDSGAAVIDPGQLDSVSRIIAQEEVVIVQGDRVVRAGEADFFVRERRAVLSGKPEVEVAGAYLNGSIVRTREGEVVIEGSETLGRAQMILLDTGGLGIQGAAALSSETIMLADVITMRELENENQFLLSGAVEVLSGQVQLNAGAMEIFATQKGASTNESGIKVGEVNRVVALDGVRIEQDGQIATSEQVTFFPSEQRAIMTGAPEVTNGEAVIVGQRMELRPTLAIVEGDDRQPVTVTLPEMPDLGYDLLDSVGTEPNETSDLEDVELEQTQIRSRMLRMIEEPEQVIFRFSESVEISATNLEASCGRLEVIAKEIAAADRSEFSERLEVERIEAHNSVEIRQSGRTATSEKASILPQAGKVVLEGNAVVHDERGQVSGHRMTLLQGQRRAIVEGGDDPGQERARITLPGLPVAD